MVKTSWYGSRQVSNPHLRTLNPNWPWLQGFESLEIGAAHRRTKNTRFELTWDQASQSHVVLQDEAGEAVTTEDLAPHGLAKLVCLKSQGERVVGFHFVGPNAGEVTQGFAVAMRLGATKADFDAAVGIHPTMAEELTVLTASKRTGEAAAKTGC